MIQQSGTSSKRTSWVGPFEIGLIRMTLTLYITGHPSVRHSHSTGAIGILGVKKTIDGVFLYFAHNTDSFVSSKLPSRWIAS